MEEQKTFPPSDRSKVNFFMLIKGGAAKFIEFVEKVFDGRENSKARTPDKDGTLIHAEVQIGDAMILVADSKHDWPFTPAFPQVYVEDAQETLDRAKANGCEIITEISDFYGGLKIARFKDPWQNIWWLFAREDEDRKPRTAQTSTTDWHKKEPSYIYTTVMEAMRNLKSRKWQ